jgi:hypothetical protein
VQGDARRAWGLRSHDVESDDLGLVVDAVCDQLVEIEHRISAQLATIDATRFHETTYEAFCREPAAVIERAATLIGVAPRDNRESLVRRHTSRRLPRSLEERARARLAELGLG